MGDQRNPGPELRRHRVRGIDRHLPPRGRAGLGEGSGEQAHRYEGTPHRGTGRELRGVDEPPRVRRPASPLRRGDAPRPRAAALQHQSGPDRQDHPHHRRGHRCRRGGAHRGEDQPQARQRRALSGHLPREPEPALRHFRPCM